MAMNGQGYMGQIYAPLTTPAGTPILVIPQGTRLIGDDKYMMQPDFRVTPEMMAPLLEGWDGTFEVAPY